MVDYDLLKCIGKTIKHYPNNALPTALSAGQLESKKWLTETLKELNVSNKRTWLMCGWYGLLGHFLLREGVANSVYSFDLDPDAVKISEELLKTWVIDNWKFKATCIDIYDINYADFRFSTTRSNGSLVELTARPELIVNTSCEHLPDWGRWWRKIRKNTLVALQNNNYHDHPDHVNTKDSLEEWLSELRLGEVYYADVKQLPTYDRYMIIGKK
jgi:hypothetical protein